MAVIPTNRPLTNEEELQQKQQGIQPVGQSAPQRTGSGTYTNLQKYLQSNTGAGQKIAGQISKDVTEKSGRASEALTEAEKVGKAIQDQKLRTEQAGGVKSLIEGVAAGTSGAGDLESRAGEVNYLTSGEYAKEAEKQRSALESSAAAARQGIKSLGERAEALGSESGRYGLLSDVYRRPSYGAGQQRLDQLLLQRAGGDALAGLQKSTSSDVLAKASILGEEEKSSQQNIKDILSQGSISQKEVQDALTKGLGSLEATQQQEFENLYGQGGEQQRVFSDLQSELKKLSESAAGGGDITVSKNLQNLYKQATGQDISTGEAFNLFNNPNAVQNLVSLLEGKRSDVVTSDELNRMNLLAKLGGNLPTAYTEATGDTRGALVKTSLSDAIQKAREDFLKTAGEQTFEGVGSSYITGNTGLTGVAGTIGAAFGGLGDSTSYDNMRATSSVADYLKDPNRFSKSVEEDPKFKEKLKEIQTYYENLPRAGLNKHQRKDLESEATIAKTLAGRAVIQERSRAQAEKDLQSKIKQWLEQQGYGRKVVLENDTTESLAPVTSGNVITSPSGSRITGSLKR